MSKPRGRRLRRSTTHRPRFETDEAGFLEAVAAAPLDDAPRLVYADWLDERGEAAKAEYLRLVVRLSAAPDEQPVLARLLELSPGAADHDWRMAVGGVFELVVGRLGPFRMLAGVLRRLFQTGAPLLQGSTLTNPPLTIRNLTRETAELLRRPIGDLPLGRAGGVEVLVRRMGSGDAGE
ncbi:MAG TPA: TIGR02996 domain-containing protein [Gemmataceae bacterium]|nr:TIGR02996 domain-containing protein [Gemmataceae bacterium]